MNGTIFEEGGGEFTEHKICVLIFSTIFPSSNKIKTK